MTAPVLSEDLGVYVGEGGRTYHRVTRIIRDVFGEPYEGVDPAVVQNANDRGREVERLCYEYALNGRVDSECREDSVARVEAFARFWDKYQPEYIAHQRTHFDNRRNVAGTLDLVVALEGIITVIDIKCTASVDKKWPLQVGAYASMTSDCERCAVLHLNPSLNKDGYKLREYPVADAMRQWDAVYEFWKVKQELDLC